MTPPAHDHPTTSTTESIISSSFQYVMKHGLKDLSLRSLSSGIDTSARMLLHYFGSAKGLFDQITQEFVRQEMERASKMTEKALKHENPLQEFLECYVNALVKPRGLGLASTIFEIYGTSILGNKLAKESLEVLLQHWLVQVDSILKHQSLPSSRERQTMIIAAANGFVLDQLATGDRQRVTAAMQAFVGEVLNQTVPYIRNLSNQNKESMQ